MAVKRTIAMVVAAAGVGIPAAEAQTIVVTPASPRAGQRVHISVPECGVGPEPHEATSAAFTADVTLSGKADTGDADPMIRKDLKPGTYAIAAHCGAAGTVRGQLVIKPAADDAPYWVAAAALVVLAGGAGVFLLRRRS
jgi:hypothetical protein